MDFLPQHVIRELKSRQSAKRPLLKEKYESCLQKKRQYPWYHGEDTIVPWLHSSAQDDPLGIILDFFVFHYVVSGECFFRVGEEHHVLAAGSCVLTNPNVIYQYTASERNQVFLFLIRRDWVYERLLSILPGNCYLIRFFSQYLADSQSGRFLFCHPQAEQMKQLIRLTVEEYIQDSPYARTVMESYFTGLLLLFSRQYEQEFPGDIPVRDGRPLLLYELLKYLQDNCLTATLENTAAYFHYSPNYLCNYIKKETGRSMKEHLQAYRLQRAGELLKSHSHLSVRSVAVLSGYNNLSYFYKIFKEQYGMTPSQFAKK